MKILSLCLVCALTQAEKQVSWGPDKDAGETQEMKIETFCLSIFKVSGF